ncbi:uncharacterized protein LOC133313087 [Gastrolobium bilobum]|uniref:uncharacterized protein LOC133313087 n=1 Tax=Gastrolobium bilobum TaxID=150636 RepID=UPI002AB0ED9B|nr:uncharacterized protein LOC133313087 [Gastrolobium bilobum]
MANPPLVRPWSRLASLRVPPAPPESHSQNTSSLDNNASVTKSPPRTTPSIQSPMQSQKLKLTPSPSPLTLPPYKLNAKPEVEPKIMMEEEPKTMLVKKTIEKPNVNGNGALHKGSNETQKLEGFDHHEKQVTTEENEMKWKGIHKKVSDSDDSGIRVLTLAGENKGAYMQIIHSRKKPNYLHKMGNSNMKKAYDYESENSANTEEGKANRKDKSLKLRTLSLPPKTSVYINSNVQCVNNSLVFNASCTYHDPGVHLTLSKKPLGEGLHLKEHFDQV